MKGRRTQNYYNSSLGPSYQLKV